MGWMTLGAIWLTWDMYSHIPQDKKNRKKKTKADLQISEYQASWFEGDEDLDEDDEEDGSNKDEGDDDDDQEEEEDDSIEVTRMEEQTRQKAKKREDEDLEFPDEVSSLTSRCPWL